MVNVVFICLGNICRSPMADGVFGELVAAAGLAEKIQVDSAGTGAWHVGEKAHPGTRKILAAKGIRYAGRARQVETADFSSPDTYLIAMDDSNVSDLRRRFGDHPRLHKLLAFATKTAETNVPDPYYVGGFDTVYELVLDGCEGLLKAIRAEHTFMILLARQS